MNIRSENKMSLINSMRVVFVVLAIAATTASCTKTKPVVDESGSEERIAKSAILGNRWVVSRGVEDSAASNGSFGAIPGISADYGVARVEITEKSLRFIKDYGIKNRSETADVLMAFPIEEHFDIIRAKNDFGDSTHKIVKDQKRHWSQREFMRVDWAHPTNEVGQAAFQAADGSEVKETDQVLIEPLKTEGNELTFATESLIGSSRVVLRTHFVKYQSSDFKAVEYSKEDFKRFGMFYTEHLNQTEDGVAKDQLDKMYAELFNVCEGKQNASCAKNKIVWHLNKGFPDHYLEKTRQVVREWNKTFQEALDRSDDIVVLDESQKVDMSDATKNVIAFYDHDVSSGLLGVAQGTVDWSTGEKLSARATTYGEGIRSVTAGIDTLIDLIKEDQATLDLLKGDEKEEKGGKEAISKVASGLNVLKIVKELRPLGLNANQLGKAQGNAVQRELQVSLAVARNSVNTSNRLTNAAIANPMVAARAVRDQDLLSHLLKDEQLTKATGESLHRYLTMGTALSQSRRALFAPDSKDEKAKMEARGVHSAEVVEEAAIRYIQKLIKGGATRESLDANRAAIKEEVAQLTYYTTLLHEMGHTFGLRHNFAGSADEANFMPEYAKLKSAMATDKSIKATDLDPHMYSSIMDYHADFYAGINGLGPYDKAAIRYAYNRSVDKKNDKIVGKTYMFCTDGEAGESVTCRRFDKGATIAEITKNQVDRLKRRYIQSHFRRDRANFIRGYAEYVAFQQRLFGEYAEARQSIDELVYGLATSPADASGCPSIIVRSVTDKEIRNICDGAVQKELGMSSLSIEQLAKALLPSDTPYKVGGFADLVKASDIAMKLFVDTIGSPEPGVYVAQPTQDGSWELEKIGDFQPSEVIDESAIRAQLADQVRQQGIAGNLKGAELNAFVERESKRFQILKPGSEARFLNYEISKDEFSGWLHFDRIGFSVDKEMALSALASRDVGVFKYTQPGANMRGNAYLWLHTGDITHHLFESVMSLNPMIATRDVEISVLGPDKKYKLETVKASVPASLDRDLQVSAMVLAMTQFATIDDADFSSKVKIYRGNDSEMDGISRLEKASFKTNAGDIKLTAFQTPDGKSIAFKVIQEAQKIADRRDVLLEIADNPQVFIQKVIKRISDAEVNRVAAETLMNADAELAPVAKKLLSKDPTSLWNRVADSINKAQDAKVDSQTFVKAQKALYKELTETTAEFNSVVTKRIKTPKDRQCVIAVQQAGSIADAPADCAKVKNLLAVVKAYQAAFEPISQVTFDMFNFRVAPQELPGINVQLNTLEDGISTIEFIQNAIGLN